jgi:hypothetical protein
MSNSESASLTIEGALPTTQIDLFDARWHSVTPSDNAGRVELRVSPGIYYVVFREAGAAISTHVVLKSGDVKRIRQESTPAFFSAAPIPGTETTREGHEVSLNVAWRENPIRLDDSSDAGLFVFVRDIGARDEHGTWSDASDYPLSNPAQGLRLISEEGSVLEPWGPRGRDVRQLEHHCMGARFLCSEGLWRLQAWFDQQAVELPVFACKGWVTHVYLLAQQNPAGSWAIDFPSASMAMTRLGDTSFPTPLWFRVRETALAALRGGYLLRGEKAAESLRRSFDDPILGIIGAHLLLNEPSLDLTSLAHIVERLATLTGGGRGDRVHPDVNILSIFLETQLGRPRRSDICSSPVFGRSWQLARRLAERDPLVIPPLSLTSTIAPAIVHSNPWLIWSSSLASWRDASESTSVVSGTASTRAISKSSAHAARLSHGISDSAIGRLFDAVEALDEKGIKSLHRRTIRLAPAAESLLLTMRPELDEDLVRARKALRLPPRQASVRSVSEAIARMGWPATTLEEVAETLFALTTRELTTWAAANFLYHTIDRYRENPADEEKLSAFFSDALGDRTLAQSIFNRLCEPDSRFSCAVFAAPMPGSTFDDDNLPHFLRIAALDPAGLEDAKLRPTINRLDASMSRFFNTLPTKHVSTANYDYLSADDVFGGLRKQGTDE